VNGLLPSLNFFKSVPLSLSIKCKFMCVWKCVCELLPPYFARHCMCVCVRVCLALVIPSFFLSFFFHSHTRNVDVVLLLIVLRAAVMHALLSQSPLKAQTTIYFLLLSITWLWL
jgi:hypothetical protein